MAISTNGLQLVRIAGAVFNQQLSASDYSEILASNKTAAELNAWANAAVAAEFKGKTTTDIAKAVLTNVGLSSIAGLEAWVAGQLTAGGGVAKAGETMLSLLNDYSNMSTTEAIYGASVSTFNTKAAASQVLSQTAGTATGTYAAVSTATPVQTFPLTTGVDSRTLGAGNDTFTSANTSTSQTLNSGDSIDGGAGTDTLTITSSSSFPLAGSGVTVNNVENISITASGDTLTLDTALMTGITSVTNSGSTTAVTVNALKALVPVTVAAVNASTTVGFASAVTAGAADAITVNINGANPTTVGTIRVDGFETINVSSTGSASGGSVSTVNNTTVASTTVNTLNVTGAAAAKLVVDLVGATSTTTGVVTSDDGAHDIDLTADATDKINITLGGGNDTLRVANVAATHTIAGGEGTDTLRYSGASATFAQTANVTGFETATLTAASSFVMPVTTVNYTVSPAGSTYAGLATGGTLNLNASGSATVQAAGAAATATSTAATTAATYSGTADSLTVNVGLATTTADLSAVASVVSALGVETFTINNLAQGSNLTARTVGISDTTATTGATKTLTVTGAMPTTVTSASTGTSALTRVDMSGVTLGATFAGTVATAGAAILGGAGNDNLTGGAGPDTITAGDGNDTISGGAGADSIDAGNGTNTITGLTGADTMTGGTGVDTYVFASNQTTASTPVLTSTTSAQDTITNFTSGTDKISITGTYAPTKFLGNFTSIQAALSEQAGSNGLAFAAAYVTSENTLYVFQNTTGLLHVDDLAVKMTAAVTIMASGDFFLGSITGGNSITLTGTAGGSLTTTASTFATANIAETTVGTNTPAGSVFTTTANDTITANVTAIPNASTTLTGGTGTDTLALSMTAGSAGYTLPATVTEFEAITMANITATSAAGSVFSLTLSAGNVAANTTLVVTNNNVGTAFDGTLTATGSVFTGTNALSDSTRRLNYTGSTGHDSVTGGAGNDSIDGGAGNDTLVGGAGNDSLSGGAGNDTFTMSTNLTSADAIIGSTGIADTLTFTTPAAVNLTMLDNVTGVEVITWTSVSDAAGSAAQRALNFLQPAALSAFAADTAARVITNAGAFSSTVDFTNVTGGSISYTSSTLNDLITGSNTLGDTLVGGDGADTIVGLGGNDTITITTGATSVNGGTGDDSITAGLSLTVADTIVGGAGNDTLFVWDDTTTTDWDNVTGVETIVYGTSSAASAIVITISDAGGFDADTTVVTIQPQQASDTDTLLFTGTNLDRGVVLTGGGGVDTLIGGAGNDTINGGAGADASINGGTGNDSLTGGEGSDFVLPGVGNDTIVLTETTSLIDTVRFAEGGSSNVDTITGFVVGTDIINLSIGNLTLVGSLLGANPTFSGTAGSDVDATEVMVIVTAAASAGTVDASGAKGVLKLTTGGATINAALGTTTVTVANIATVEVISGLWYDNVNSQAVFVAISAGADGTITNITQNDVFVEIARVGMTSADYAALGIGSITFS